ncbi:MAG: hypothetical protein ABI332_06200 [Polyangiaceae bacterium]
MAAQGLACTPDRAPIPTVAEAPSASASDAPSAALPPAPRPAVAVDRSGDDGGTASGEEAASGADAPSTPNEEDAIREVVFRHMFGKNASSMKQSAGVYCLSVAHELDPSPVLIARLGDVKVPVKGASACSVSAESGVVDKVTKKRGLVFRILSIKVAGDMHHATVEGGYYEAGLSSSGSVYTLEKGAKGWVVTKEAMKWIS